MNAKAFTHYRAALPAVQPRRMAAIVSGPYATADFIQHRMVAAPAQRRRTYRRTGSQAIGFRAIHKVGPVW